MQTRDAIEQAIRALERDIAGISTRLKNTQGNVAALRHPGAKRLALEDLANSTQLIQTYDNLMSTIAALKTAVGQQRNAQPNDAETSRWSKENMERLNNLSIPPLTIGATIHLRAQPARQPLQRHTLRNVAGQLAKDLNFTAVKEAQAAIAALQAKTVEAVEAANNADPLAVDQITLLANTLQLMEDAISNTTEERQTVLLRLAMPMSEASVQEVSNINVILKAVKTALNDEEKAIKQKPPADTQATQGLLDAVARLQGLTTKLNNRALEVLITPPSTPRTSILQQNPLGETVINGGGANNTGALFETMQAVGKLYQDARARKNKLDDRSPEYQALSKEITPVETWLIHARNERQHPTSQIQTLNAAGLQIQNSMQEFLTDQELTDPLHVQIESAQTHLQEAAKHIAAAVVRIQDLHTQLTAKPSYQAGDTQFDDTETWLKKAAAIGKNIAEMTTYLNNPTKSDHSSPVNIIAKSAIDVATDDIAGANTLLKNSTSLENALKAALPVTPGDPPPPPPPPLPSGSANDTNKAKTAHDELRKAHDELQQLFEVIAAGHNLLAGDRDATPSIKPLNENYKIGNPLFDEVKAWSDKKTAPALDNAVVISNNLISDTVTESDIAEANAECKNLRDLIEEGKHYQYLNPILKGKNLTPLSEADFQHMHNEIKKRYSDQVAYIHSIAEAAAKNHAAIPKFAIKEQKTDELLAQLHNFLRELNEAELNLHNAGAPPSGSDVQKVLSAKEAVMKQIDSCIEVKRNFAIVKNETNVAYYSELEAKKVNTLAEAQTLIGQYHDGTLKPVGSIAKDATGALDVTHTQRRPQHTEDFTYRVVPYQVHYATPSGATTTTPINFVALQISDKSKGIPIRTEFYISPADLQILANLPNQSWLSGLPHQAVLDTMIAQITSFQEKNPNKSSIYIDTTGLPENCVRAFVIYCDYKEINPSFSKNTPDHLKTPSFLQTRALKKKMARETNDHREITYTQEQATSGKTEKEMEEKTVLPSQRPRLK